MPELAAIYAKWLAELGIDAIKVSCGATNYSYMNMCRGDVPTKELVRGLSWWEKPIGKLMISKLEGKYDLEEGYNLEAAKLLQQRISKKMKGFTRRFKPLEILPEKEVDSIHNNTLHVLETVGVKFESKKALALFKKAGCKVDESTMAVRFPPSLVEECLKLSPTNFRLSARDPENSLRIGEDVMHFYNSVGLRHVDLSTWEPRAATMKEQDDGVRVLDALENLHVVNMYTPYMEIEGAHLSMLMLESLASRIRNTTKVIVSAYSNDSEIFAIEIAKALELELLGCMMVAPPLRYYPDACEAAFRYVEAGFPIFITSGVSFGATGPVTTAGSTITNNAELLAGLVLVQLIRPGTGVIVANFAFPMDMKTAVPVFGSLSQLKEAISDAQNLGSSVIGLTGGEPLLRDDLEDIIAAIDQRSMPVLFTTGYKLTQARVKSLKKAGLEIPVISLDHYSAEIHDKGRRKEGIFA